MNKQKNLNALMLIAFGALCIMLLLTDSIAPDMTIYVVGALALITYSLLKVLLPSNRSVARRSYPEDRKSDPKDSTAEGNTEGNY